MTASRGRRRAPPASTRDPVVLAIVLAALAVRLVVVAQLQGHPLLRPSGVLDDAVYVKLAQQAAGGDWALGPGAYYVSPLYLYFLAALFRLGAAPVHAQVVQTLLGAVAVLLVAHTAERLFERRAARVAASLCALTGVFVFNEALLLQSALDPFLAALALERLSAALSAPRPARWMAAGAAFGLLGLNRPNALLAAAAVAVLVVLTGRTRAALARAALLAGGMAAVLLPVAVRNRVVAGEWLLVSSHGGLNFWIGNSPRADGTYQAPPGIAPSIEGQSRDMRRIAEAAAGRPLGDGAVSAHFYGLAWRWIRERPADAARLFARKLAYTLHAAEIPLNYSFAYWAREEPTLLRALPVGAWLLLPLGLAGFFVPRTLERRAFAVWASFVPAYALAVAAFFVASRYRLPILVALCVTAGGAASALWTALNTRAWTALRVAAAVAAAALALAFWPWGVDDGAADERAERALHLIVDGRGEEARALLARTLPAHRDPALLQYRVGRAWLDAGQPAAAVPYFEQALAAAPGQGEVHLVLGQALLRLQRPAEAVPHLRQAFAAGAFRDVAGLDLARALLAADRAQEARAAVAATPLLEDTDGATAATLADLALGLGDAEGAVRFAAEAVRRAPSLARAHKALGVALGQLGRAPEALAALEAAARLDPADPTLPYNLALLHARAGRLAEARRLAERSLALDPGARPARALLDQLPR
jgi:tetratricopeptide (TPR) repeat protein